MYDIELERIIREPIQDDAKDRIIASFLDIEYNLHATLFADGATLIELPECFGEDGKYPLCFSDPRYNDNRLSYNRIAMMFDDRLSSIPTKNLCVNNSYKLLKVGKPTAYPFVGFATKKLYSMTDSFGEDSNVEEYKKYIGKPVFFIDVAFGPGEEFLLANDITEEEFNVRAKEYLERDYSNYIAYFLELQSFVFDRFVDENGQLDFSNWGNIDDDLVDHIATAANHKYNKEIKEYAQNYRDENGNSLSLDDFELIKEITYPEAIDMIEKEFNCKIESDFFCLHLYTPEGIEVATIIIDDEGIHDFDDKFADIYTDTYDYYDIPERLDQLMLSWM